MNGSAAGSSSRASGATSRATSFQYSGDLFFLPVENPLDSTSGRGEHHPVEGVDLDERFSRWVELPRKCYD